jgi:hypothetical protein
MTTLLPETTSISTLTRRKRATANVAEMAVGAVFGAVAVFQEIMIAQEGSYEALIHFHFVRTSNLDLDWALRATRDVGKVRQITRNLDQARCCLSCYRVTPAKSEWPSSLISLLTPTYGPDQVFCCVLPYRLG